MLANMSDLYNPKEEIQKHADQLHPVVGEAFRSASEEFAKFLHDEQLYAFIGTLYREKESRSLNAKVIDSVNRQFKEVAAGALMAGDYNFFKRMARAIKIEGENPMPMRGEKKTAEDPTWICFVQLAKFVFKYEKLPTPGELQSLAKLSNDQWARARSILNLTGKLPRKPKIRGI